MLPNFHESLESCKSVCRWLSRLVMSDIYKRLARLLQYSNHSSSVFYFPSPLLFGVRGLERFHPEIRQSPINGTPAAMRVRKARSLSLGLRSSGYRSEVH